MRTDNHSGFTLIGVMVAVVILGVLILTVAQVMTRAEPVVDTAREQFIAAGLAREGLELVRAVRDTNWFSQDDRSRWLAEGLCDDQDTSFYDTDRRFTLDVNMVRTGSGVGDAQQATLFMQPNGLWVHTESGNERTPYQRVLSIDCSNKDSDPPQVLVASQVTWDSRGQARQVEVREKLFNWLP